MNCFNRISLFAGAFCAGTLLALSAARANPITIPNGDFEDYTAIPGWSSLPSGYTYGGANDEYYHNDESYATHPSYGSGWQNNGPQSANGKWGLDHPAASQHHRTSATDPIGPLDGAFDGYFIGSVNLEDGDGTAASVQSGILGQLAEGTYTLTFGIGARPSTTWNDVSYSLSLVSDPVLGAPANGGDGYGSESGTVLGTPSDATLIPSTAVLGTNDTQTLTYTLTLTAADAALFGHDYAIRLDMANTGTKNGDASPTSTFTQGNFDNATLDFVAVPEPASMLLAGLAGIGLVGMCFRRRTKP